MIAELLNTHPKILGECAVSEPLSRMPGIELHPTLFNTPLIYGPEPAREALADIYRSYIAIAAEAELPLMLTAPTWRLDAERVRAANVPATINRDAVAFLRDIVGVRPNVTVGALLGPKNDCYKPELAPGPDEAEDFHAAQVAELARTDADFLMAQTLPAVGEAIGLARAMARSGKPYIISFCTGTDGHVLDGTRLEEAILRVDDESPERPPLGYFVNCTSPSFHMHDQPASLERLIGIQANGSSKDVRSLEDASETVMDPIDDWARSMLTFHAQFDVPVLGGCCGTAHDHMRALC